MNRRKKLLVRFSVERRRRDAHEWKGSGWRRRLHNLPYCAGSGLDRKRNAITNLNRKIGNPAEIETGLFENPPRLQPARAAAESVRPHTKGRQATSTEPVFAQYFTDVCFITCVIPYQVYESPRAERPGDRIPVEARFSAPIQTGPGAQPTSCTMGTGSLSRG